MLRLSRSMRLPRWMIAIGFMIWLAGFVFCIWLVILNHLVTRELVQHRWREPTIIYCSARKAEVTRLYGVVWRPTPPISIRPIPRYVGDAFIAAEDVRFHHHIGVDPIGL